MKRTLIISLSLLALVGACGVISPEPTPLPTATPDTPMFSEEEVLLIWEDWLKANSRPQYVPDVRIGQTLKPGIQTPLKLIQRSCDKFYFNKKTNILENLDINYLGDNIWEIKSKIEILGSFGSWKVFEKSQRVKSENERC